MARGSAAGCLDGVSVLELTDPSARWWTRIWHDPDVDVWLLSWLPGHTTELHDHGDSAAAFTVVRGALTETRAEAGTRAA